MTHTQTHNQLSHSALTNAVLIVHSYAQHLSALGWSPSRGFSTFVYLSGLHGWSMLVLGSKPVLLVQSLLSEVVRGVYLVSLRVRGFIIHIFCKGRINNQMCEVMCMKPNRPMFGMRLDIPKRRFCGKLIYFGLWHTPILRPTLIFRDRNYHLW